MITTLLAQVGAIAAFLLITKHGPNADYVRLIREPPLAVLIIGIAGFALLNATAEEFIYRGVLQSALTETAGTAPAIVIQAALFGLVHLHGVPGGWFAASWPVPGR